MGISQNHFNLVIFFSIKIFEFVGIWIIINKSQNYRWFFFIGKPNNFEILFSNLYIDLNFLENLICCFF